MARACTDRDVGTAEVCDDAEKSVSRSSKRSSSLKPAYQHMAADASRTCRGTCRGGRRLLRLRHVRLRRAPSRRLLAALAAAGHERLGEREACHRA